ncbi:chloramphenicol phosphotransferase CPT [Streptomyces caeruleatus]
MTTQVIMLNGGSSSGKTAIARALQDVLPEPWLAFSIDDFVDAMPSALQASDAGLEVTADGGVSVGADFMRLEAAWMAGLAATVRAGARVVVDDVFLGGPHSQERWRRALSGLDVLWVGVHCEPAVAAARELARGDRVRGMAEKQARIVHEGVAYDIRVDTTDMDPATCARAIARAVVSGDPGGA